MTQLLVDIGNTRLKWGIVNEGIINSGRPLVHIQDGEQALFDAWKNLPTPDCMAVSCVGSKKTLALVRAVAASLWPMLAVILAKSQADAFGVRNAYPDPEKLGVDRWLCLLAVRRYYPGNVCIIDCGTAITVDLMDAQGRHRGGFICPGLALMKKALADGTAALPLNPKTYSPGPANSTDAAIYSGTLCAAAGLIEHTINKEAENSLIIMTGGDAGLIAGQLACRPIIDDDLVLKGLATILAGPA